MTPNRNILWGKALAQELARGGVRHVCIAPGSRSGPLVFALNDEASFRITTHHDERSMGYFALGIAKATSEATVLVTTSGTAVANLLPAVVEAHASRVPLILLTADRPPELQDVGANQAIRQPGIFGSFTRFAADLGMPEPTAARLRHVRGLVGRALALARGPPSGPVHLNAPFREPLDLQEVAGDVPTRWDAPDLEAAEGRTDGQPFLRASTPLHAPDPTWIDSVVAMMDGAPRGIIVAGPRFAQDDLSPLLVELSAKTGYPILADALSGLRFGDAAPHVLSGYDAFLADARLRRALRPEVVLRFGAAPTSKSLATLIREAPTSSHVLVDESNLLGEESSTARFSTGAAGPLVARALAAALGTPATDKAWRERWERAEAATWSVLEREIHHGGFEGAAIARIIETVPSNTTLVVSNSLPVRDLERFARGREKPLRVLANRGASGIDGILSTALGAAHGLGRAVTAIVGDVAFLHDIGALATQQRLRTPMDWVLINNDGGGIFEFLPASRYEPAFTEFFVAPHGLDLARIAKAFGLEQQRFGDGPWTPRAGNALTECVSDRKENARRRREIEARLSEALAKEAIAHAG